MLNLFNISSPSFEGYVWFVWIEAAGKMAVTLAFN